nr:S41 family peptidase [uncultured Pedobacter sp.]
MKIQKVSDSLLFFILFLPSLAYSQSSAIGSIRNYSFEISKDSLTNLPSGWWFKPEEGFSFTLDSLESHSKKKSLRVTGNDQSGVSKFAPFSQVTKINIDKTKIVVFSVYIKTKDVIGNAGFWCQIWDKNDKQIDFNSLDMTGDIISGTNDWKKYTLRFTMNEESKKIVIGGFLKGRGQVWYDDFTITESPIKFSSTNSMAYVTQLSKIIKENSLVANSIKWDSVNLYIHNELERKPVFDNKTFSLYIMSQLKAAGDNHSFILSSEQQKSYSTNNLNSDEPIGKLLDSKIAYINIPTYASDNEALSLNFASKIQKIMEVLDNQATIAGWIIDLRNNSGGNMFPMVAGLGPILGNGILGYFLKDEKFTPWWYREGKVGIGDSTVLDVHRSGKLRSRNKRIAVLIGPMTASSGEMLAISFLGKHNVKTFGSRTAGYVTGNEKFALVSGDYLYLATSRVTDRFRTSYDKGIIPAEISSKVSVLNKDLDLMSAQNWLESK